MSARIFGMDWILGATLNGYCLESERVIAIASRWRIPIGLSFLNLNFKGTYTAIYLEDYSEVNVSFELLQIFDQEFVAIKIPGQMLLLVRKEEFEAEVCKAFGLEPIVD